MRADRRYWTVAYRHPRANHIKRVPQLALTWEESYALARKVQEALPPGFEVYYVTTAEADAHGFTSEEDRGNVLVASGRRVRMRETGVLPEGVTAPEDDRVPHIDESYRTANGVVISPGLRVITNDLIWGTVEAAQFTDGGPLDPGGEYFDGWFYVMYDDGRRGRFNGERMSTRDTISGSTDPRAAE